MSLLAIQLPPRRRLGQSTPAADAGEARELPLPWAHVFSANGITAGPLQLATAASLPHRALVALRAAQQQLGRSEWRTVHMGLWALAALQLVGLNAAAWSQQQTLQARHQGVDSLLRGSLPGVHAVLDAPTQMRNHSLLLRAAAGQPGAGDLETALAAAAAAWLDGKPPVTDLRFESARLTLASPDWRAEEVAAFGQRLTATGWTVAYSNALLTLQHPQPRSAGGRVEQR